MHSQHVRQLKEEMHGAVIMTFMCKWVLRGVKYTNKCYILDQTNMKHKTRPPPASAVCKKSWKNKPWQKTTNLTFCLSILRTSIPPMAATHMGAWPIPAIRTGHQHKIENIPNLTMPQQEACYVRHTSPVDGEMRSSGGLRFYDFGFLPQGHRQSTQQFLVFQ